mmetsp:Transcript_21209/g.46057  ORF Transcript_21209/g.46057 Transcript_21209/m.46057 type:complete len:94 (+) Transcript_21209:61-342(+)
MWGSALSSYIEVMVFLAHCVINFSAAGWQTFLFVTATVLLIRCGNEAMSSFSSPSLPNETSLSKAVETPLLKAVKTPPSTIASSSNHEKQTAP